jgi:SAM-dependent methyltransferase
MQLIRSLGKGAAWLASRAGKRIRQFDRFPAEPWFIDVVDASGAGLKVQGWAFIDKRRPDGDYSARFSFNGRPFDSVLYPLLRKDVGDCFPARMDAAHCGFILTAVDVATPYRKGVLEITCHDEAATGAAAGRNSWFVPDPARHKNLPDEDRRYRVIANRDAASFLMSGCTDLNRLDRACRYVTGHRIAEHERVLDWGCGCGRLARHLDTSPTRLFGCDIDAENIGWCAENLPGQFSVSSLRPPLPYSNGEFNLIYGLSVFTHFRPAIEALWLAELRRVAAPGAILLMTIHGRTTVDFAHLDAGASQALLKLIEWQGIVFSGRNDQLDGHANHQNEYVNVYHSERYIHRTWGRHFEIVELLRGYIFTHDLVIMRKRK